MGSSHVNKLERYIREGPGLQFDERNNPEVVFYGISGGRINKNNHCLDWESKIIEVKPDFLVFHAGGNDLDTAFSAQTQDQYNQQVDTLVDNTILRLTNFLNTMRLRYNIKHILVLQLTFRTNTREVSHQIYNDIVIQYNRTLKETLQTQQHLQYWKIRNIMNQQEENFIRWCTF